LIEQKALDITAFIDDFLKFEEEKHMFDIELNGIKIWQYMRVIFYRHIRTELMAYEIEQVPAIPEKYRGKKTLRILFDQYFKKNQMFARHRDVLLVSMARKQEYEKNHYRCIYTDDLETALKPTKYVLSRNNRAKDYVYEKSKNIINFDVGLFMDMKNITYESKVNKYEAYDKLISPIEEWFGIHFDIRVQKNILRDLNYRTRHYYIFGDYYRYLLKKIRPKVIVLTAGYDLANQVLIKIAKEKNIPTIELEHGMTGKNNMAYNFLKKRKLECFPDYFFCFGQYDRDTTRWPIETSHVIAVGFPNLEKQVIEAKKELPQQKNHILFISQMNNEIFTAARDLAARIDTDKYKIVVKLHPSEYARYYEDIEPFFKGTGVEVIHTSEKTLYHYFNEAAWIVGEGSSTALFEATMFDSKIAVLKTERIEDNILVETGKALGVDNIEELVEAINHNTFIPSEEYSFFEEDSINKMCTNIEEIMKKGR